jgi:hypothetical protein
MSNNLVEREDHYVEGVEHALPAAGAEVDDDDDNRAVFTSEINRQVWGEKSELLLLMLRRLDGHCPPSFCRACLQLQVSCKQNVTAKRLLNALSCKIPVLASLQDTCLM